MEFHDVLYGRIALGLPFNRPLFEELVASPELTRLRNMRLMNFDVPLIQELGSAKRLPHSIGVCYLAQELGKRTLSSEAEISTLMVAGLLHDAAIPPYGHLVESTLRKQYPDFNHEEILGELLHGTYHRDNRYHQIVPGLSLKVHGILDRYGIKPADVLSLVQPKRKHGSAISAQIDIDNIDNVHRMACLMGWSGVRENLHRLIGNIRIDREMRLQFAPESISSLQFWQDIRQRLYTLIISHPDCVAQNAFQSDLVRLAIDQGIIEPDKWFISEPVFEDHLRQNSTTKPYAEQLVAGIRYRLVDYVWFTTVDKPPCMNWMNIDEHLKEDLPQLTKQETYFTWVESGLISRPVAARMTTGELETMGVRSYSCLIARVHTQVDGARRVTPPLADRERWRERVRGTFEAHVGRSGFRVLYPEDYTGSFFPVEDDVRQLELC